MSKRASKRASGDVQTSTTHGAPKKQKGSERRATAKEIMERVHHCLQGKHSDSSKKELIQDISEKISELNQGGVKKKTSVGVFGKTGAGKSALINAILGEKDLLPSGVFHACTSVITQIGANITDMYYTAEIEFISKEEWEEELKNLLDVLRVGREENDNSSAEDDKLYKIQELRCMLDKIKSKKDLENKIKKFLDGLWENSEDNDEELYRTAKEKITALYGKEGVNMSAEDLMEDDKHSRIQELVRSKIKTIKSEQASDLKKEIRCYIQHDALSPGGCYWPIVKSVTISVPNCEELLEHIVLVDLPGTGDCNKSRDKMWKLKLRECSAVWIVSEINRACSEKEAWELVSDSLADMEPGGECKSIAFICTKTDTINAEDISPAEPQDEEFQITQEDPQNSAKRKRILHMNSKAKEMVREKFFSTMKKHFNCDDNFLSVFTVSSREFTKNDSILKPEETEIPKLKEVLRTYNSTQANQITSDYISEALGILYLIQAFKGSDTKMTENRSILYEKFKINLSNALQHLEAYSDEIYSCLEELLSKGAKESEEKCSTHAKRQIQPKKGGGFHRTLTALCKNDGYYRSKKGKKDLNTSLAKHMLEHIDEAFKVFFPVRKNVNKKSLQANVDKFTITPEDMFTANESSQALRYMLKFLRTEEEKLKTALKQEIVERKKEIHASLSESIKATMLPCYQKAAGISGHGSMKKQQDMLLNHIESEKSEMFQKAKTGMLEKLRKMLDYIVEKIRTELMKSMEYSRHDASTLSNMDVSKEIEDMEKLKSED